MSRSTPRLSEIARHLVVPSGIVATGWPGVRATLSSLGIELDPWQVQAAQLILGKRSDGLYAAGIGGIGMSIPRQVGKTFLVGALVFALGLRESGLTVIWTAHQLRTSNETFKALQALTRMPKVGRHVKHVRLANGEGEIAFVNGSRILFGARERGFGLGFAKVGVLVFDEAQRATQKALDDMIPTTNTHPNPLIFAIGTPPRPTDPGEMFTGRRVQALAGEDDGLWLEFGADPGCRPSEWAASSVDWGAVAAANPSFPARTPKAAVLRMKKNLGIESFAREGLGLWDADRPGEQPVLDVSVWDSRQVSAPADGADGVVCWGVRFSPDGGRVALAGAQRHPLGVFVEVIDERPAEAGVSWLVDWLRPRWERAAQIVVDGKAGSGALVAGLDAAGVGKRTLLLPTVGQVIDAHGMLLQLVRDGGVGHSGQPGLRAQVEVAGRREIGRAGGWGFRPLVDGGSVTSLEAAVLAVWAASTTRRRPGRGGGAVL